MSRHVKGTLFADYVRMIRARKEVDWSRYLDGEDIAYLARRIEDDEWYPMLVFEHFGNAILEVIAGGSLDAVNMWGRLMPDQLIRRYPDLVSDADPLEAVMRFRVLRSTFFDFEAFTFILVSPGDVQIAISYQMSAIAEEAASHQSMGFFSRVLEIAGAMNVEASLTSQSWRGDATTVMRLVWV